MIAPSPYELSRQPEVREAGSAKALSADNPGVIAPPPLLYGLAFLVGAVLHSLFPTPIVAPNVAAGIGLTLLCIGAVLAVWSRRTMEGASTNVNPSLPATTLVISGPFQFSLKAELARIRLSCVRSIGGRDSSSGVSFWNCGFVFVPWIAASRSEI